MFIKFLGKTVTLAFFTVLFGVSWAYGQERVLITKNQECAVNEFTGENFGILNGQTCNLFKDVNLNGWFINFEVSNVTLDCNGHTLTNPFIFDGTAVNVFEKENITIENCRLDGGGIFLSASGHITIKGNHLFNLTGRAISALAGFGSGFENSHHLIKNNKIEHVGFFETIMTFQGLTDSQIKDNEITANNNSFFGLNFDLQSNNNLLKSNKITGTGIIIFGSSGNEIVGNDISGFTQGQNAAIAMIGIGFTPEEGMAFENVIKNNKITNANQSPSSAGIVLILFTEGTIIKNNNIQNNSVGLSIRFDNSGLEGEGQTLQFDNNTIKNNASDDIVVSSSSVISCDSSFKNNSNLTDNLKFAFLNKDNAVLSGDAQQKYGDIIICADGVEVEGVSAETIILTGADNGVISDVTITGNLSSNTSNQGLVLVKSNNNTISDNEMVDNQNLVYPSDGVVNWSFSSGNSFSNNNVSDNVGMTAFQGSHDFATFGNQLFNNTANGNGNGFDARSNATVIGNTANNNTGVGFIISGSGSFYDDNTAIGNGQNVTLNVFDCSNTIGDFDTGGAGVDFIYATSTVNQSGGNFATIVLCDADNSQISNVTTANIILINTDNAVIEDSVVSNAPGNGITLDTSSAVTISNNDILNSGAGGIFAFLSPDAVVSGNNISGAGFQGINLVASSDNWIIQNNVVQNGGFQGIAVNSSFAVLTGNTVEGSFQGIAVNASFVTLTGNTTQNNFGDGVVFFTGASDVTFDSNLSCDNGLDVNRQFGIATVNGDQNTCDTTADYTDASAASGCVFACP
jgi:parallel beta-helix repeat protein